MSATVPNTRKMAVYEGHTVKSKNQHVSGFHTERGRNEASNQPDGALTMCGRCVPLEGGTPPTIQCTQNRQQAAGGGGKLGE